MNIRQEVALRRIGTSPTGYPKYELTYRGNRADIRYDSAYPESDFKEYGRAPKLEVHKNLSGLIWGTISQPISDAMNPFLLQSFLIWKGGTWSTWKRIKFISGPTCVISPYEKGINAVYDEAYLFDRGQLISLGKCDEIMSRHGNTFFGRYFVSVAPDGTEVPYTHNVSMGAEYGEKIRRVDFKSEEGKQTILKREDIRR